MSRARVGPLVTVNRLVNALIVGAVAFALASLAWGLDVQDITVTWTPEGKQLATEHAKLPAKDEVVLVPAGPFLMGSTKQVDRNAYPTEFPQRRVYLDAFEIDKYEVPALQYLKFVLATTRPPLLDWRYDGGNFKRIWRITR